MERDIEQMKKEITRLREDQRRWKVVTSTLLVLLGAAFIVGAKTEIPFSSSEPGDEIQRFTEVRAQRFVLEDKEGQVRAFLIDNGNGPMLSMLSKGMQPVLIIAHRDDNNSIVRLAHDNGDTAVQLLVSQEGVADVSTESFNGGRVSMGTIKDKGPSIGVTQGPYSVDIGPMGESGIGVVARAKSHLAALEASTKEGASISVSSGKAGASLYVYKKPQFVMIDESGDELFKAPETPKE